MSQRVQPARACKRVKGGKFPDSAIGGDSIIDSSASECSQGRSVINYHSRGVSHESLLAQGSSDYFSSFRTCSSSTEDTVMSEEDATHALDGLEEGEEPPRVEGVVGDPGPMGFNTFMTHMNEMIKNMATMTGATAGGQASAEMNRQINNLAPHKDGADIAKYIRKLEADLRDIGVPAARFKSVLYQKLQSKMASAIVASLDRNSCTYAELKETLVDALGSSRTSLGIKLISDFQTATKTMSSLETFVYLKGLTDSISMVTDSKDDVLLFIACAVFRATRPLHQRGVMDSREVASFKDLNKLALTLQTSDSDRSHVGRGQSRGSYASSIECYKCHKMGHRAFECKSNVGSSGRFQSIVCHTCREPGHKSPDCPNRGKSEPSENNESRSESGKKLNLKKSGKTYNTNWVAVRERSSYVDGIVNGTKCQIVPDSGAEITIVPGCLVYEHQLKDEKVQVRGWKGVPEWLHTAVVDFQFQGRKFKSLVAVACEDTLCGRVLYSVPMDDSMAAKLLLDAASVSDASESRAGQLRGTRNILALLGHQKPLRIWKVHRRRQW